MAADEARQAGGSKAEVSSSRRWKYDDLGVEMRALEG
jgi:hypothetical protein